MQQVYDSTGVAIDPWDLGDVLSLKTFPGTSVLRYGRKGSHLCVCDETKRHRSLFDLNLLSIQDTLRGSETPEIEVCHNADNIWEAKLPREITGLSNRVAFCDLPNVETCLSVLSKGTYWYNQVVKRRVYNKSAGMQKIARLLAGLDKPHGFESRGQVLSMRPNSAAVQRFRSLLAIVDGLLMQVTLAFPMDPDIQSWARIDQIQRSLIAQLLDDYFKDTDPDRVLTFSKVKDVRKDIKRYGFNPVLSLKDLRVPRELSAIGYALSLIRGDTPLSNLQVMIMSQTRASGVPPRSIYDRTLAKTREILTTESNKDLYHEIMGPLQNAVDQVYDDLLTRLGSTEKREEFFNSLINVSKISLSDSGEFFTPTAIGGKLEAARRILQSNPAIPEVDLHTGRPTGKLLTKENSTEGSRLFHWSCGKFNRGGSTPYTNNSMSCRISLVAELGKYRTITVSTEQHSLLLHPLSHIGLAILGQFPSSASGVGAANHAWNFFKRLSHKNPSASFIFDMIRSSVFSTDWEQATDYSDPYIAGAILNRFLMKLGVPEWYRKTALFALTAPRQVELMDRNGVPIEKFYTKRGVLMGDPVTKVVLHLYHLVGGKIAKILLYDVFSRGVNDTDSEEES
jgi:hypothetical protein